MDDLFLGRLDPNAHPFYQEIATLRVSAHFLIRRQGALTQYVPTDCRAWHAGVSRWQKRTHCNDFSLGIELEGDEKTPFETVQYYQLARLIRTLQRRYPAITDQRIVSHQQIAPQRKWDPGPGFDWHVFYAILAQASPCNQWPLVWQCPTRQREKEETKQS